MGTFNDRMQRLLKDGSVGQHYVNKTNLVEDKLFTYDQAYKRGFIYDWDMNPIEEVDFKIEKTKVFEPESYHVEYYAHFRSDFNPEHVYRDKYYRKDGRDRFGFYLDVYDNSRKVTDKWLIMQKDDRVAFDRYVMYKCNWCLEWITDGVYHQKLIVVRDKYDNGENDTKANRTLGGTSVSGDLSFDMPSSEESYSIRLGTRLIISDNIQNPIAYEVVNFKDITNLGLTKFYLVKCLFNKNTDFVGHISNIDKYDIVIDKPTDLPDGFGNSYHMIANCIRSTIEDYKEPTDDSVDISKMKLSETQDSIYINGSPVTITALNAGNTNVYWHFYLDGIEYSQDDLTDYFDIVISRHILTIKAISQDLAKYILKVAIYDENRDYYDFVEMEVKYNG